MAENKQTLQLGSETYEVTLPPTVGQYIDVRVVFAAPEKADPVAEAKRIFERALEVIAIVLREDYPEVTVETLRKLRVGPEVGYNPCYLECLKLLGLSLKKADEPGEAEAEAAA